MRHPDRRRNFVGIIIMTLLLAMAMPATSFGKDKGQRHGRNFANRKCGKFVNCHDARDGRWDKRGRRNSFSWQRNRTWRNHSINNNWVNNRWRNVGSVNGRQNTRWRNVRTRDNRWRN